MRLRHLFVTALLAVASLAQAQMQMPPVPADPDVRIGKLENGLTYYIRHNNWPEHRANFYIAQKVGSIQEEESQRGLAHFLEHMAFNGSDNFKGNGLIEYLRSIGVEFGRDLNAYTSIDQTVYNINNVPTTNQASLDSCLLILRDWSTGLSLDPEEIDKERGVIHEEWRLRTSASSRMFERNLPALYPNSKYGVRYPIGLMEVVDNFKPQELRDYYQKWYHPSNQGLIIVGDVDVDHTEAVIKQLFADIKNPENALPVVDEPVPDTAEPIVIIDKDKEMTVNGIDIMFKSDPIPDEMKDNVGYLLTKYMINAAVGMLNNRLREAAQEPEAPFTSADADYGNYIFAKTKDAFTLSAMPKEMSLTEASLKAVLIEARKAAEFGFTETEYDRYKENYLSQLEKQYSNKEKRFNEQFYVQYREHFLNNEPMPSIDYRYQTMTQMVPMMPLEAVNNIMAELLPKNDSNMVIISFNIEADDNYPTKEGLLKAVNEARAEEITAFVDNVKDEPLLAKLPKPGKIKKEIKNEKFGYTELYLSNGTKVTLLPTDYKKDQVILDGEGPGAQSLYGEGDYANIQLFDNVIGVSGLANFSSTELQKALAGKIANANLTMGQKYMSVDGNATPKDVETMFQMLYLYFTGINKDQKAYDNLMNQLEVALKNRDLTPEVALSDSLTATLYGHNHRLAPMTVDLLKKVDYDRILAIAKERTANVKDWTFRIVGNFDVDSIKPLVCQYIGSLPAKGKVVHSKRVTNMVEGQVDNIFTRKMETPKANAYMIWHNNDMPYTLENSICADIAGQVLSMVYLKKIREEASAAYTCGAQGSASIDDDFHQVVLLAYCPMKPEKKQEAIDIMNAEVPALAEACDAEMLQKVKEVMLKQADDRAKTNQYWNGIIHRFQKYGIDSHTDYKKIVSETTPADIEKFMKEFLNSGNKVTVIMLPEETEE
ncbi:MAG: insulinase family protein [Prevotella sp.]|nr:insulinase family protein [Prevotella sp.]